MSPMMEMVFALLAAEMAGGTAGRGTAGGTKEEEQRT